jgi:hypothetical protein
MRIVWCVLILIALSSSSFAQQDPPVQAPDQYGGTAFAMSASGSGAQSVTIKPTLNTTTVYLCGFSIRAYADNAKAGSATVTGLVSDLTFLQWTAPSGSGIGVLEPPLGSACLPAKSKGGQVQIQSADPGANGMVSVNAWGFFD